LAVDTGFVDGALDPVIAGPNELWVLTAHGLVTKVCCAGVAIVAVIGKSGLANGVVARIIDGAWVPIVAVVCVWGVVARERRGVAGIVGAGISVITQVDSTGTTRALDEGVVTTKNGVAVVVGALGVVATERGRAGHAGALHAGVFIGACIPVFTGTLERHVGTPQIRKARVGRTRIVIVAVFGDRMANAACTHRFGGAGVAVVTAAAGRRIDTTHRGLAAIHCAVVLVVARGFEALFTGSLFAIVPKSAWIAVLTRGVIAPVGPSDLVEVNVTTFTSVRRIQVPVSSTDVEDEAVATGHRKDASAHAIAFIGRARPVVIAGVRCARAYGVGAGVVDGAAVVVRTGQSDRARWGGESAVFGVGIGGVRIARLSVLIRVGIADVVRIACGSIAATGQSQGSNGQHPQIPRTSAGWDHYCTPPVATVQP
jgi:hypothetical protein